MDENSKKYIIKYLGEKKTEKLFDLYRLVNQSNIKLDDDLYKKMLALMIKYYSYNDIHYLASVQIRDILSEYYKICFRLITKISNTSNVNTYDICNFINSYTEENISYKLYIVREFKKIGIIEKRSEQNFNFFNIYKKLLQVFSVKYKRGYNKTSLELYDSSRIKLIKDKGKEISKILLNLNKKTNLRYQKAIIKPTVDSMEIMCNLSDYVVDNESIFKDFICDFYKLFWENEIKNYDVNNDLVFINNLRKYFFHDLAHSRDGKYKKKTLLVKNFFEHAIKKIYPESAKDWQRVQEYIYDLILDFLNNIDI